MSTATMSAVAGDSDMRPWWPLLSGEWVTLRVLNHQDATTSPAAFPDGRHDIEQAVSSIVQSPRRQAKTVWGSRTALH